MTIMTLYISPSILLGMIIFDIVFDEIFYCVLILPYYLLPQQDFHFEMNWYIKDDCHYPSSTRSNVLPQSQRSQ